MFFNSNKQKDQKYEKFGKKDDKLVRKLDALGWDDSKRSDRLYRKHSKALQKFEKYRTWHLPRRERGWRLPNDD